MSNPMKLVFFCAFGFAANRLLLPKARHARANGFEVSFVFSPGTDVDVVRAEGFDVHTVTIPKEIRPPRDLVAVAQSYLLLRRLRPDIVSTHFAKGGAIGRTAALLAGVPYVLHTPHGFSFQPNQRERFRFWLFSTAERVLSRCTDVLLTQTADDAILAGDLGFRPRLGDPIVIGNGIDLDRFDPESVTPDLRLRHSLGVAPSTQILATFARVNEVKGLRDLVNALSKVRDLDWILLQYGPVEDQELFRWLKLRLEDFGLTDRFLFQGMTDFTPQVLKESDWFILPSHIEGMPRSLIEAQAMGVPAIVTDIRGSRDIVKHNESGFIVDAHDPDQLSNALRAALSSNEERRNHFAAVAKSRARSLYDEELVKERLLAIYKKDWKSVEHGTPRAH